MPRKLRTPKIRVDQAMTPALRWWLMVGRDSEKTDDPTRGNRFRLLGWLDVFQLEGAMLTIGRGTTDWQTLRRDPSDHRDVAATLGPRYCDAIVEEARAHGFRAWLETGESPAGVAFERWRDAFLEEHLY
jgi:hypothetical protein